MKKTHNVIEYIFILVIIAGAAILILQLVGEKISQHNQKEFELNRPHQEYYKNNLDK